MFRRAFILVLAILMLCTLFCAALAEDDFSGFYDVSMYGQIVPDINLILTPGGHGRLINSTDSVTFDYTIENGLPVTETSEMELIPGENSMRMHFASDDLDITLDFVKRDDVQDDMGFIGSWVMCGLEGNGQVYSKDVLATLGISGDMQVYANGAIDWHAITNEESRVAQGWGVDDQGIYIKNGAFVARITVDGDTVKMEANGAVYQFERAD